VKRINPLGAGQEKKNQRLKKRKQKTKVRRTRALKKLMARQQEEAVKNTISWKAGARHEGAPQINSRECKQGGRGKIRNSRGLKK